MGRRAQNGRRAEDLRTRLEPSLPDLISSSSSRAFNSRPRCRRIHGVGHLSRTDFHLERWRLPRCQVYGQHCSAVCCIHPCGCLCHGFFCRCSLHKLRSSFDDRSRNDFDELCPNDCSLHGHDSRKGTDPLRAPEALTYSAQFEGPARTTTGSRIRPESMARDAEGAPLRTPGTGRFPREFRLRRRLDESSTTSRLSRGAGPPLNSAEKRIRSIGVFNAVQCDPRRIAWGHSDTQPLCSRI